MRRKNDPRSAILEALRNFPFQSQAQLRWLLAWNKNVTQRHLWEVHRQGLVRRYAFNPGDRRTTQWLYVLTTKGLHALADPDYLTLPEYCQKYGYSISRLRWLAVVLERVNQSRQVLQQLISYNPPWSIPHCNFETESLYEIGKGWRRVTYHCSALLQNRDPNLWLPIVIEWDTGDLQIQSERTRWRNFAKAQKDIEFFLQYQCAAPVLFYVAKDFERLQEFYNLFQEIIREVQTFPLTLLTYRSKLEDRVSGSDGPEWYYFNKGEWVTQPLTTYFAGSDEKPRRFWELRPLRQGFASTQIEIEPLAPSSVPRPNMSDMASLALALYPIEKKLLRAIGSHPMLIANELALLLETAPSKVWEGLERLRRWQLIKSHNCQVLKRSNGYRNKVKAHTLSDLGVTFLATAAGLGPTPKRLALAHGWEKGFNAQIDHAEHTRIGNELFLQLLKYARERGYPMRWYSEQEARLYLNLDNAKWSGPFQPIRVSSYSERQVSEREEENAGEHEESYSYEGSYSNREEFFQELAKYGTKYERFLPDGRAVLQIGEEEWHIAAEIDLTRANYDKMIAKLNYYYMMMQFYLEKPTLCILIVTHHWIRARNLYWLAWRRATQDIEYACSIDLGLRNKSWAQALEIAEKRAPHELQEAVLPIFITTKDDLRKNGMDKPIWLRVKVPFVDGRLKHTFTKTRWMEFIEEQSGEIGST